MKGALKLLPPSPELMALSRVAAEFRCSDFDEWVAAGKQLCLFAGCSYWWVGDWINFAEERYLADEAGKKRYGIKYRTALEITGLELDTLRHAAWVSRAVKVCNRLHELPWAHHREVAGLAPDEQDKFLRLALKHGWNRSELRQAIRKANKTEIDEPRIDVGFMPGRWANELRRGFKAEIERFGPVSRWNDAVRDAWREGLAAAVEIYRQLEQEGHPR